MKGIRFSKYQALGNDYLVFQSGEFEAVSTPERIRRILDRHRGVGADGVLVDEGGDESGGFRLRIFNPDGSEAEKSGNGLRIFSRYLWDRERVGAEAFAVETAGGTVTCRVGVGGHSVSVEMGRVRFHSLEIPVTGPPREVLRESLALAGETLEYSAATLGNPHCVIHRERVSEAEARRLGPLVETEPRFPNRTNVQFCQVLDRGNLRIEIWERGAGYTLASGSSGCAAAAVAHRLELCGPAVSVQMPGGALDVEIAPDFSARMTGPVGWVAEGELSPEFLEGGD